MLPDNMKTIDKRCADTRELWDFYNNKYDIPHELSFAAFRRFYMSVKRENFSEAKKAKKLEATQLIEDAKLLDKKLMALEEQFESA